ncbi:MAG: sensor histidine kinase [Ignavibacteriae bacterium HGW-Ignavibacteriae-3]|nr:MAG: sensor histidine kinase [Ignavibacteriae bacterium HGW-Ignavibacteriae-3]
MKKNRSLLFLIFAFIFAQFAWLGLLGLWIYWYVVNYLIIEQVGDKLSPQIVLDSPNVLIFVGGIILIVLIATAMFLIFRNLTVQVKLTKLYDNFISNVTHELKSPLASIQLYLETLHFKDVPPEKQKEFYALMIRDSKRLKKLIDSILEISRLEKKRIAHNFHIYNADEVIRQLISDSIEQFRLTEGAVKILGEAPCKCVVDKDAMQIVFDNLTDNAMKYSIQPAEITIKLSCAKKYVVVEFADKGIGINQNNQKYIFNKFQRIDNRNIPNVKGTGLGLYWVKGIIKFHGGKITASSEGLNKGTTFKIELPIYQSSKKFYVNRLLRETARKQKKQRSENGE